MAKIDKNERTLYQFWTHTVQKLIECSGGGRWWIRTTEVGDVRFTV